MSKLTTTQKIALIGAFLLSIAAILTGIISIREFGLASGRGLAERIIVVGLLSFAASLLAFAAVRYYSGKFLEKGDIRSAIAIVLTVMYVMLLPLSVVPNVGLDFSGEFLKNFHLVYVAVIGFYFGTSALAILKKGKE